MNSLDRVMAFLESEAGECPESWMEEGLEEINRLRKIAKCFKQTVSRYERDSWTIEGAKGILRAAGVSDTSTMMEMMNRLQAAAKLAEGGA